MPATLKPRPETVGAFSCARRTGQASAPKGSRALARPVRRTGPARTGQASAPNGSRAHWPGQCAERAPRALVRPVRGTPPCRALVLPSLDSPPRERPMSGARLASPPRHEEARSHRGRRVRVRSWPCHVDRIPRHAAWAACRSHRSSRGAQGLFRQCRRGLAVAGCLRRSPKPPTIKELSPIGVGGGARTASLRVRGAVAHL
jgi:hypothetical protein